MKTKRLAALHAALFTTLALTLGLLLFPITGLSGAKAANAIQKADLLSAEDFVEYASINEVDIHDLYFSVILYEGTESCARPDKRVAAGWRSQALDSARHSWSRGGLGIECPGRLFTSSPPNQVLALV